MPAPKSSLKPSRAYRLHTPLKVMNKYFFFFFLHDYSFNSSIVSQVDLSSRPFKVVSEGGSTTVLAKSLIIATGAVAKRLPIPGAGEGPGTVGNETNTPFFFFSSVTCGFVFVFYRRFNIAGQYWNRGVSACAVCDGAAPIFRNNPLIVIGGGDSAMEEATFLTKYASGVTIVHRSSKLRASKVMQERAKANPKITFVLNAEVVECLGDGKKLGSVVVRHNDTGSTSTLPASGLFFAIGHTPATAFLQGQLKLDEDGYIATNPGTSETSVEGVFAAGDVQDKKWRQAITAAGSGCVAALQAEHFVSSHISSNL